MADHQFAGGINFFLRPAKGPTLLRSLLPAEEVFDKKDRLGPSSFRPLLAVDLSLINPEWSGDVHFLFGGGGHPYCAFRRVDGGRKLCYTHCSAGSARAAGGRFQWSAASTQSSEDLGPADLESGFVEAVAVELPALRYSDHFQLADAINSVTRRLPRGRGGRPTKGFVGRAYHPRNRLGMPPMWDHSVIPIAPGGATDVFYIGQVRADDFSEHLGDDEVYLFYCPSEDVQIITSECT